MLYTSTRSNLHDYFTIGGLVSPFGPKIKLYKTMKKLFSIFAITLVIVCAGCKPGNQEPVSDLTLEPQSMTLKVSEMATISFSGNAGKVTWTCSDTAVVSVTGGVVVAKAIGCAKVTATDNTKSVVCTIYVVGSDGSSLRLTPGQINLEKGDTCRFMVGNTYNLPMTWSSSDESIASVDESGLVHALKPGNAFIILSTGGETIQSLVSVLHYWGEYTLVWSDEFEGTTLDENIWGYNTGGGGWGNRESQYYTSRPENVRVEDGNLIIEARKEEYEGAQYTSARILSRNKKDFTYGKIEASISLPDGGGLWPAFWMLGYGGWPACGEIDIMEYVGNVPGRVLGTLHTTRDRDGARSSRAFRKEGLENSFHTYGIEWTQEEKDGADVIRFYVDGEVYSEQIESKIDNSEYWPFNKPEYLIINMAVGGTLGGNIKDEIFDTPRLLKVDWVRVYQRTEIE